MRDLTTLDLDHRRVRETEEKMISHGLRPHPRDFGVFSIPYGLWSLNIIASRGGGWEHVSVSIGGIERCPTWEEMDKVKRAFFKPTEAVMQLHPPEAEHISNHPYTLHLWRPIGIKMPMPPGIMV